MKIKSKIFMPALLAIAGAVSGPTAARAALTYTDGDILLGFRETASPQNALILNLGASTQFTGSQPITFGSLSSLGADLAAKFGISWSTRADLYWGAFGAYSGNLVSLYGTRERTQAGTPATSWGNPSQTVRNNTSGGINTVNVGFVNTLTTTESTNIPAGSSNIASAGFQTGTALGTYYAGVNASPDFNGSSPFNGSGIEGSFGGTKILDFFALSSSPTIRLGTFTINGASGAITYTPVPEPSALILGTLAAGVFLVSRRLKHPRI